MKAVISTKDGNNHMRELPEQAASALHGKRIGDSIKGELIDLTGYELQITGGSTSAGFPLRRDAAGEGLKKIFSVRGIGTQKVRPGQRVRKTVAGNIIGPTTAAVNLKVLKEGKAPLAQAEAKDSSAESA